MIVSAVLAILAALMFPVFRAAIDAAKRSHCVQNYRQIGSALSMYRTDYDDRVPPANYEGVSFLDNANDRTWVQTLLPYIGNFSLFMCPGDTGRVKEPFTNDGPDGTPGDPWDRFYMASLRSNLGFNYIYLSPLVQFADGNWASFPVRGSDIVNPSGTIGFIDSVWDRGGDGMPYGGGSWVVVPPCRYVYTDDGPRDSFRLPQGIRYYFGFEPEGWQPKSSYSWLVYGGAWPWHRGSFNVLMMDGRVLALKLDGLLKGCDFLPEWQGLIHDLEEYPWDIDS